MEEVNDVNIQNVRSYLGFGRCNLPISACAPVCKGLLNFFSKCGIEIVELYGMTECGVSVTNVKETAKLGSVGRPIMGTQVKINSVADNTGEVSILLASRENSKHSYPIDNDTWSQCDDGLPSKRHYDCASY